MKIYESIPEPQRQRIRRYWIQCSRENVYDREKLLDKCNKRFFGKIGAETAEKKLHSKKQGESQFFRKFLQDWELHLEFAGGCDWPDSFKISQLGKSLSEKMVDKLDVVDLPKNGHEGCVDEIARVATNIESRNIFIRKGEAQITQFTARSGIHRNDFQPRTAMSNDSGLSSAPLDHDGDIPMSGMKIDLQTLLNLISTMNVNDQANKKKPKRGPGPKPSAPWRSEKGLVDLRVQKQCIRWERPGHIYRYCKLFGPAKRPT
ncbi:hypothetical protein K3495_g9545 [Podosphaera aphanis]|nr:hypothetical protein K3495_g9545 [Podosphaera aphanis]